MIDCKVAVTYNTMFRATKLLLENSIHRREFLADQIWEDKMQAFVVFDFSQSSDTPRWARVRINISGRNAIASEVEYSAVPLVEFINGLKIEDESKQAIIRRVNDHFNSRANDCVSQTNTRWPPRSIIEVP